MATTDLYYAGQQLLETADRSPLPPGEGQGEGPANGATAVTQQYVWSARYVDSPVESDRTVSTYNSSTQTWTAATDRLYYLTDANNNVTAVTDASGVVQERYSYGAYGNVTVYSANWTVTGTTSAVGNTLFFAGMNFDPTTGLFYDRARWYNSSTGGYLSANPVRSDKSLYRYVGNDPIGKVDPSGLVAFEDGDVWTAPGTPGTPQTPGPNPSCGAQQGPGDTGTVPNGYDTAASGNGSATEEEMQSLQQSIAQGAAGNELEQSLSRQRQYLLGMLGSDLSHVPASAIDQIATKYPSSVDIAMYGPQQGTFVSVPGLNGAARASYRFERVESSWGFGTPYYQLVSHITYEAARQANNESLDREDTFIKWLGGIATAAAAAPVALPALGVEFGMGGTSSLAPVAEFPEGLFAASDCAAAGGLAAPRPRQCGRR